MKFGEIWTGFLPPTLFDSPAPHLKRLALLSSAVLNPKSKGESATTGLQ